MLLFTFRHEFHETCHSVTLIVVVNSHQRWKQMLNRSLLSSLVWINSGIAVSQHRLESFFHEIKCNRLTIFMEFMLKSNVWPRGPGLPQQTHRSAYYSVTIFSVIRSAILWRSAKSPEQQLPKNPRRDTPSITELSDYNKDLCGIGNTLKVSFMMLLLG